MAKLIVGCGYVGQAVAEAWLNDGHTVLAVTRSASRAGHLAQFGLQPLVADVTQPLDLPQRQDLDTVLYAVGFDRSSGKTMQEVYVEGLERVLAALPENTGRIVYLSSTGVYGQTGGQWVDEDSPCQPDRPGGRVCLAAEEALRSHRMGQRTVILRLAGIYGPGRLPLVDLLRRGELLPTAPDATLNLIHRDDVVSAVLAAESRAVPPALYTVSDGHPVVRREFYEHLAHLLDTPPPRFAPADAPGTRNAAAADKRVSNQRLLSDLQIELRYPDYRHGLASLV